MGVMACSRKGCESILCDRYSPEFGYICNDCFEELCNEGETDIHTFMKTERNKFENLDKQIWRDKMSLEFCLPTPEDS